MKLRLIDNELFVFLSAVDPVEGRQLTKEEDRDFKMKTLEINSGGNVKTYRPQYCDYIDGAFHTFFDNNEVNRDLIHLQFAPREFNYFLHGGRLKEDNGRVFTLKEFNLQQNT